MASFKGETYTHDDAQKVGVLLMNLGTPDAPTPAALRKYLAEFLWDPRIVELPRPLWWLILNGIILRTRPAKSAQKYQSVWTEAGSPLLVTSRRQVELLNQALKSAGLNNVVVALGMRYGNPSVASALEELKRANVRRVLVLPLYPQYSATTTGSTFDAIADELKTWRWVPELRFINSYHDHDRYIEALAESVRRHWASHPAGDRLVFSFHGTPRRYFDDGDPYYCLCQKTARLVAERLQLPENKWMVTFQSRFGKEEWLQPYTDATMESLPGAGVKKVDVICPGFSVDCLETLEEIAEENREIFLHHGGETFNYIPCLNDSSEHVKLMLALVQTHTQGWPVAAAVSRDDLAQTARRAQAKGAAR
ncbi:MAG: ferrochelatase [Pseudomonadota bacterium]